MSIPLPNADPRRSMKHAIACVLMLATVRLGALEFESAAAGSGSTPSGSQAAEASVPQPIDAGDVPTAYGLLKYEMRTDIRFYSDGGILTKVDLGIYPRFFIGGALNVPGLINAGPVTVTQDDASLLARFIVMKEDASYPSLALGWDGPAYDGGEKRGLYLVASKEFRTPLGFFQAHGGLNTSDFDSAWQASRDLRGFGALTSTFRQLTGFCEADEINDPGGPRYNAGARFYFDPISLGLEFRDIGATRAGTPSSRMLRVSYSGLF
jgi:hypothetical protein